MLIKHLQRHVRLGKYALVGAGMTLVNVGLLTLLVAVGMTPSIANIGRTGLTTHLQFELHRHFTCREQRHEPYWQQCRRYYTTRAGTLVGSQVIFNLLLWWHGYYLVAYLASISAMGVLNYILTTRYVFTGLRSKLAAA